MPFGRFIALCFITVEQKHQWTQNVYFYHFSQIEYDNTYRGCKRMTVFPWNLVRLYLKVQILQVQGNFVRLWDKVLSPLYHISVSFTLISAAQLTMHCTVMSAFGFVGIFSLSMWYNAYFYHHEDLEWNANKRDKENRPQALKKYHQNRQQIFILWYFICCTFKDKKRNQNLDWEWKSLSVCKITHSV